MPGVKKIVSRTFELIKPLGWYLSTAWGAARSARRRVVLVVAEQLFLYVRHRVDVHSYFTYRLFDPHLSWEDKTTYLPSDGSLGVKRMILMHTPMKYWHIYRNKLVFNSVFSPLPMARIFAVFNPEVGAPLPVAVLADEAALDRWMRTTDVVQLAYKPVYGTHGHMILIFTGRAPDDPGAFLTLAGERYDAKKLSAFSGTEPFLFEERIQQHAELTALLGETLCCVRVVTIIVGDGTPRLLGAVFKLQANPLGVDHLVYGAVGSWVDIDSGRLYPGRTRFSLEPTWQIPGTDRSFEGFCLPCWEDVKTLALRAAAGLPEARSIGWDIAISTTGPVLIEGNEFWSVELLQLPAPYGLMRGEFKALCEELKKERLPGWQEAAAKMEADGMDKEVVCRILGLSTDGPD